MTQKQGEIGESLCISHVNNSHKVIIKINHFQLHNLSNTALLCFQERAPHWKVHGCKSPQRTLSYAQRAAQGRHPALAMATLSRGSATASLPPAISRTPRLGHLQRVSHQPTVSCPPTTLAFSSCAWETAFTGATSPVPVCLPAHTLQLLSKENPTLPSSPRQLFLIYISKNHFFFFSKSEHTFHLSIFYRAALSPQVRLSDFSVSFSTQLRILFF